jgi:DNA-binding CsgD family transcriptional regulator
LLLAALVEGNRRCDAFLAPLAAALLIRLYSQSGRLERALEVDVDLSTTIASITGEYLSSRAVALACVDRIEESITLADQAQSATRGIEARVLGEAARLIAAIRGRRGDVRKAAENLLAASEDSNGVDLLVSAYRSSPDLLAVLVRSPDLRARLLPILRRTGDDDALGLGDYLHATDQEPGALLSPREFEVYELVCRGLSNVQIGTYLFISEATVKVHVHHIFDKLGIRSRYALALDAARRRAGQATDAT